MLAMGIQHSRAGGVGLRGGLLLSSLISFERIDITSTKNNHDTWLILPVVICLSQRLSHARVGITMVHQKTADGSLNQL